MEFARWFESKGKKQVRLADEERHARESREVYPLYELHLRRLARELVDIYGDETTEIASEADFERWCTEHEDAFLEPAQKLTEGRVSKKDLRALWIPLLNIAFSEKYRKAIDADASARAETFADLSAMTPHALERQGDRQALAARLGLKRDYELSFTEKLLRLSQELPTVAVVLKDAARAPWKQRLRMLAATENNPACVAELAAVPKNKLLADALLELIRMLLDEHLRDLLEGATRMSQSEDPLTEQDRAVIAERIFVLKKELHDVSALRESAREERADQETTAKRHAFALHFLSAVRYAARHAEEPDLLKNIYLEHPTDLLVPTRLFLKLPQKDQAAFRAARTIGALHRQVALMDEKFAFIQEHGRKAAPYTKDFNLPTTSDVPSYEQFASLLEEVLAVPFLRSLYYDNSGHLFTGDEDLSHILFELLPQEVKRLDLIAAPTVEARVAKQQQAKLQDIENLQATLFLQEELSGLASLEDDALSDTLVRIQRGLHLPRQWRQELFYKIADAHETWRNAFADKIYTMKHPLAAWGRAITPSAPPSAADALSVRAKNADGYDRASQQASRHDFHRDSGA